MECLIAEIEEEFVGLWRFRTIDESPSKQRWCASVLVAGRLVDTEDYQTAIEALLRAVQIVKQLR